ncbi:MAG: polysaccharide deacetylase family protein [Bacteroidetes bacterium]|nr:polysaccharide deacetylase family protein [Bacteroidota bacterium]
MNKHTAINVLFTVSLLCLFFLHLSHGIAWYWYVVLVLLYTGISAAGSYFIGLSYFLYSYTSAAGIQRHIAITFDDGPNEKTGVILDILKENKAPATFFCIGQNIPGNEAILKRMAEEGHLIGNHSYRHRHSFPLQQPQIIAAEIAQCNAAIEGVTGQTPRLFRPPFGVTDPMVARGIAMSGMYSIGWSMRSYDTIVKDPQKLLSKVSRAGAGDIILFHEAGIHTAAILSQFIQNVRAKGLEIVPLDRLLDIDAYEK